MKNNKKRHTILKRRMSVLTMLIPCFLMFGCAKDITPSNIIPPAPKATASVLPSMNQVNTGIDNTIKENLKLEQKLKEQKEVVLEQKIEIVEAIAQAEKMKQKVIANEVISELETTNLIDQLKKVETRNLFLETKNTELSSVKDEQDKLLKELKTNSSETLQKLLAKEDEAYNLRTQNDYLGTLVTNKNSEVTALQKALEKEKVKAATAGVYRNWIIGIVSGFVLWTIVKNIIMIYSPIKFRI
jgi:hypothetical protein